MGKKRPERTARRVRERDLQRLMRDRARLADLLPGGSEERPIEVDSPAVIELRAASTPCPICGGELEVSEHRSGGPGLRAVAVRCRACHAAREIWFRLGSSAPS